MNELEIAQIIGFVHALCPAQKINEFTPDAWELVLEDIAFEDARAALKTLGRQLRFIAPADIAAEIRRVSNSRASFTPGSGLDTLEAEIAAVDGYEVVADYLRALRADRRRVRTEPVSIGAAVVVERTFIDIPSKRPRTNGIALSAPRPLLALEAAPVSEPDSADPEHATAMAVLKDVPGSRQWVLAARKQLESEGVPLTRGAVAIRAADLATRGDQS